MKGLLLLLERLVSTVERIAQPSHQTLERLAATAERIACALEAPYHHPVNGQPPKTQRKQRQRGPKAVNGSALQPTDLDIARARRALEQNGLRKL